MSTKSEIAEFLSIVREKTKSCGLVEISKLVVDSSFSIDVDEIYIQHIREIMSDFKKSLEAINLITNFSDLEVVVRAVKSVAGAYMEDEHIIAFEERRKKLWPIEEARIISEAEEKALQCKTISEIEVLHYNADMSFVRAIYKERWIQIAKERISVCKSWLDIDTLYDEDVKIYTPFKDPSSKLVTIDEVKAIYRECYLNFSREKALADASKCQTVAQAIKQLKFTKKSPFYSEEARAIYTKKYQRLARKVIPAILKRCDTSEKVMMVISLYILDDCPAKIYDICRLKWLQLHIQENF